MIYNRQMIRNNTSAIRLGKNGKAKTYNNTTMKNYTRRFFVFYTVTYDICEKDVCNYGREAELW